MPRLDAERIALWRSLDRSMRAVTRRIDAGLTEEFGLPLAWFEVLAALHRHGGTLRVHELCDELGELPSSLSRRLDRLVEHGHVVRDVAPSSGDRRAVAVSLTRDGRALWRDANVAFRRLLQQHFARDLTGTDLAALQRVEGKLRG